MHFYVKLGEMLPQHPDLKPKSVVSMDRVCMEYVEDVQNIRGEKKFKGIEELKNQIKKDILKAKKIS